MNTNDLLTQWSNLSLDEIEARLVSGQDAEAAAQLLGADSVASMSAPVSFGPPGPREAVVLLPGIMGSLLSSIRGVTTVLWINPAIFLRGQSNYLELNSDGSADYNPAIETVPVGIEKLIYLKLSLALHREMTLFEFPYDWRRPIEWNADILAQSIERWADGDPARRFTLIGHSMGGIVARTYLARHTAAAEQRIKRAVTLGTPHYGAANAIENLVMGNKMIEIAGRLNPNNTADRLLLNLPSFYELFPAPPAQFPKGRAYPANWDVYNAAAWQWPGIRQDYLDLGRRFHEMMAAADPQVELVQIAGCNLETTVGVRQGPPAAGKPKYELVRQGEGPDAGDGTVPLWSAILPGVTVYFVEERHRYLPGNGQVIQGTLDLINGGRPSLPTQIPKKKTGLLSFEAQAPTDPEAEAQALRQRFTDGTATEEDYAQLYFAM